MPLQYDALFELRLESVLKNRFLEEIERLSRMSDSLPSAEVDVGISLCHIII